jgi:hypothetical protein
MSEPFDSQDKLKLRPPKEGRNPRTDLKVGHYMVAQEPRWKAPSRLRAIPARGNPTSEITVGGRADERAEIGGESLERSPSRPVGQFSLCVWCARVNGIGSGVLCQEDNRRFMDGGGGGRTVISGACARNRRTRLRRAKARLIPNRIRAS